MKVHLLDSWLLNQFLRFCWVSFLSQDAMKFNSWIHGF